MYYLRGAAGDAQEETADLGVEFDAEGDLGVEFDAEGELIIGDQLLVKLHRQEQEQETETAHLAEQVRKQTQAYASTKILKKKAITLAKILKADHAKQLTAVLARAFQRQRMVTKRYSISYLPDEADITPHMYNADMDPL
jgi:hypothetical protein